MLSKLTQFRHKAEYCRASPLISPMALSFIAQYMHVMAAIRDTGKAWFTVVGMDSLSLKAAWKIRSRDENKIKRTPWYSMQWMLHCVARPVLVFAGSSCNKQTSLEGVSL